MTNTFRFRYFRYQIILSIIALSGLLYTLVKLVASPASEIDFKFIWLAGLLWGRGDNPYGDQFATEASSLFGGGLSNVPQYWFYGPNWWPVSRIFATVDLS